MDFAVLESEAQGSHEALDGLGFSGFQMVRHASVRDIFEAVQRGLVDKGIVPIESSHGCSQEMSAASAATLECLTLGRFIVHIQGEYVQTSFDSTDSPREMRFIVIGRDEVCQPKTGRDKTTWALYLKTDRFGALSTIANEFRDAGINLTMFHSLPVNRHLGDCMFLVSFEGHEEDGNVSTVLICLRQKLREVRVFGSYPRA